MRIKTKSHKIENYERVIYFGLLGLLMIIITAVLTNNLWYASAQKKESDEAQNFILEKNLVNYDDILRKADENGYVSIIVGFNFNFMPEGKINNSLKKAQRVKIADGQNQILKEIENFKPQNIKQFESIPYLALTIDARGLDIIKKLPEVTYIIEDGFFELNLAQSREVIRAPQAWQLGYSGQGQVVAILDTGIDKNHPFLNGKVISEACYSNSNSTTGYSSLCLGGVTASTVSNSGLNCSYSGCEHGTHVAGIAAGKEIIFNGELISGIAKDANLVAIQVFSYKSSENKISAQFSDIIRGLERVRELKQSGINIASANMSLGSSVFTSNCDSTNQAVKYAIDNLQSLGVATIVAAGNGDSNGNGYINGISSPACISTAVSVGSTGLYSTIDDNVSQFSNSASFLDLLAPGYNIYSSVPGGIFLEKPGTSMAAPHVAGAWAILKQRKPNASVAEILTSLFTTGQAISDTRGASANVTKPRIRIDSALQTLSSGGCPATSITVGQTLDRILSTTDCVFQGTKYYDVYKFNGTVGQQIAVSMNSSLDTYLYLVDENGNVIGENDDISLGVEQNSRIPVSGFFTLPATGTYSIWATSFDANITGNYTINLSGSCSYSISQSNQNFIASGGSGSVALATASGCAWTATSNVNWITITSGASGNSNGTVGFSVAANTSTSARSGIITIGGQAFTVNQSGAVAICPAPVSIVIGQTVNGSLQNGDCQLAFDNSYYDAYTFTGTVGQQILITMNSTQFNTFLFLYQGSYPSGTELEQDDNGGGSTNARIPANSGYILLPATGTYTVLANSAFVGVTGSYTLSLMTNVTPTSRKAFDFDGDGKTDISVFRPSNGQWWINRSSNGQVFAAQFGQSTDKITPADFTGDGKTDITFFRPSTGQWFVLRSEDNSFFAFPFGATGDIPVPADYDGDGKADAAVFRPSSLTWYISLSNGGVTIRSFGVSGDVPAVADYDGDGKADIAIYRPSLGQWWIQRSAAGTIAFQFGSPTDKLVQSDYTGDGKADVAFFRPSTNQWFVLRSENNSFYAFPFGANGDVPTPGDYDGDGKADAAVFRPSNSTWFVQRTTAGTLIQGFGQAGDNPVPSAFVP